MLRFFAVAIVVVTVGATGLRGASLATSSLVIESGQGGTILVAGAVSAEETYGVEVLLELVPQFGAEGTVTFTPAPPNDIAEEGDPWPAANTFSSFDTDLSGTPTLNGSVSDDGQFVPVPVTYTGLLASFPIQASEDARGTWEVRLSTSVGDSTWADLPTTLIPGVITVNRAVPAASGNGLMVTLGLVLMGSVVLIRRLTPAGTPGD